MTGRLAVYGIIFVMLILAWGSSCVIYQAAEIGEKIGALDDRSFDQMTVIAIGTGNEFENPDRLGPSVAIAVGPEVLLVDAGRGISEALRGALVPPSQPATIFLTSLLPENTLGLDDLLFTGWRSGRDSPLRVVGPVGTQERVTALLAAYRSGIEAQIEGLGLPAAGAQIDVEEVGDGWSEERENLRVRAGAIPGGPTPALAWSFEATRSERRVVVSGVGWGRDALADFARGADLLMHEAVYIPTPEEALDAGVLVEPELLERDAALHTSLTEVGELARLAEVRGLGLTRLRPPPAFSFQVTGFISESYDGDIWIPADGDEYEP